jgi:hypothetical protein
VLRVVVTAHSCRTDQRRDFLALEVLDLVSGLDATAFPCKLAD